MHKFSRMNQWVIPAIIVMFLMLFFGSALSMRAQLMQTYKSGIDKLDAGQFQEAIELLSPLGDYQDSLAYIDEANRNIDYIEAIRLFDCQEYEDSLAIFFKLDAFKNSQAYAQKITALLQEDAEKESLYAQALVYLNSEDYLLAMPILEQLGDYQDSQLILEKMTNAIAILKHSNTLSAGVTFSAAVTEDGFILSSGDKFLNHEDVADWDHIVSISVMGSLAIGLKMDGTVVVAGELPGYRIDTSGWNDITSVAAGDLYVVGLRKNGTLTAQGHNGDGQADIDGWTNIVAISTGWRHTVGLDADGNIHITGYGSERQLQDIASNADEWRDIVAISAGGGKPGAYGEGGHTVALRRDGTVVAVGDNRLGQCNVGDWTDVVAISAGAFHTVGLKRDGTVVTTQTGELDPEDFGIYEEISGWRNIAAISSGYGFTLGLKEDGTVVGVGYYTDGQRKTEDWKNVAIPENGPSFFGDIILSELPRR